MENPDPYIKKDKVRRNQHKTKAGQTNINHTTYANNYNFNNSVPFIRDCIIIPGNTIRLVYLVRIIRIHVTAYYQPLYETRLLLRGSRYIS